MTKESKPLTNGLDSPPQRILNCEQSSKFPNASDLGRNGVISIETFLKCSGNSEDGKTFLFTMGMMTMEVGYETWTFTAASTPTMAYKFDLQVNPNTSATNWSLRAHVSVFFRNKKDSKIGVDRVFRDVEFKFNNKSLGFELANEEFSKIFDFSDVVENKKEEEMTVELQICVVHSVGFRNRIQVSYDFSARNDGSDFILKFPSNKIAYVNLGFLAQHSDYFAGLHRRLSEIPKDPSTDLPFETFLDVDYDEFVNLLLVVYPSRKAVDDSIVSSLLELADRYLFEGVLSDIEKYLMSPQCINIDVFTKLQWSCTYQMADLQGHVLSLLKSRESILRIKDSPIYSTLSAEVTSCLFERLLDPCMLLPCSCPSVCPYCDTTLPRNQKYQHVH